MPQLLEERVSAAVASAIAARNGTLEQLVRQAVDRELERLVAGMLETELAERVSRADTANGAPTTKACKTCGRDLSLDRFEKHRRQCRECRRGRERRAVASTAVLPDSEEPPRPGDPHASRDAQSGS
jgi:hypothetical protein